MAERINIDVLALQDFVAQYKASFAEHRLGADNEIYKWKAVKCFQDNWNIDAEDFLSMVKAAFAQTYNLLASQNNFPGRMIEEFTKVAPDEMRSMFRELFDESIDLARRVGSFEKRALELCKLNPTVWKSHYQTPNSISTYLWLHYPDKYYIYKYSVIKDNAQKLCGIDLPTGKIDRMIFGYALYDAMCEELKKDSELVAMSADSLNENCYADEGLKTLTIDIGYYIGKHDSTQPQSGSASGNAKSAVKNIILYGTPGTGKTYSTVLYAVSVIEEKSLEIIKSEDYAAVFKRYLKYKDDGLIAFTTFHQSFGYEEFIEGIRPVVSSDDSDESKNIEYEVRDGIFKAFCDKAGTPIGSGADVDLGIGKNPRVWKIAMYSNADPNLKQYCFENGCARLGKYDVDGHITDATDFSVGGGRVVNTFHNKIKTGDIIVSPKSSKEIDAIGVVSGDAEWLEDDERGDIDDYHRSLPVKWLAVNISVNVLAMNANKTMMPPAVTSLPMTPNDVMAILHQEKPQLFVRQTIIPNRVFIIDEINRGNVSKIFGELITLVEPSKRIGASEELRAILPYSGQHFGVPDNVFIIGTMNTADRSIALIDTALRRRFSFVEMQPDSGLLRDVVVDGIDIAEMLDTMNRRITVLLDREHTIGHSYLLPLKNDSSVEKLADIFESKIVPLLQEYFYDDYEKIQLVLGDNQKSDDSIRFVVKKSDAIKLFGNADIDYPEFYEVNREAFKRIEAYAFLN